MRGRAATNVVSHPQDPTNTRVVPEEVGAAQVIVVANALRPLLVSSDAGRSERYSGRAPRAYDARSTGRVPDSLVLWKPAARNPRRMIGLRDIRRQTRPVRASSRATNAMPRSMPITSGSHQFLSALKASAKPYRPQMWSEYRTYISVPARSVSPGTNSPPATAPVGQTVPSCWPSRGARTP